MPSPTALAEFRTAWLPHIPDSALLRLVELIDKASPLLIHGAFARAIPQGCIASQIAWHHPATEHLTIEAGVAWLTKIAKLNPATSVFLVEWDRVGLTDWNFRQALLKSCTDELERRTLPCTTRDVSNEYPVNA